VYCIQLYTWPTKTNIKCKVLSVSEKLEIIKKVDTQLHVTCTKVAEQFSIPASTLNNIIANKKNILQQCVTSQPGRKKLKASKYEKTELVLLEWFRQKQALNIPILGPVLRQKAEEITLKLNTEFTPLNRWLNRFRKRAGLSYRTVSGE
jgi:transposase